MGKNIDTYLRFDQILSTYLLTLKMFKLNVNKNFHIFLFKSYYFKLKKIDFKIIVKKNYIFDFQVK